MEQNILIRCPRCDNADLKLIRSAFECRVCGTQFTIKKEEVNAEMETTGFARPPIISQEEAEALVMAIVKGKQEFTEEEAHQVVKWAMSVKVNDAILNLVLDGRMNVTGIAEDGKPILQKGGVV